METLTVNGRYLMTEGGEPFFYLADTAWEILHQMSREEMAEYFKIRASQGFTCIQTVILAELDGLRVPNHYGRRPLLPTEDGDSFDPEKPDLSGEYSYWDHVDYALSEAEKNGLYLVLLPTWGDKFNICWGKGPEIFTEENAYSYGEFLGKRYKDRTNIIWMLGGDRTLEEKHRKIVDAMAVGIKSAGDRHLMTFHPNGRHTSLGTLGDQKYIDFHTSQTGHDTAWCLISDQIMVRMSEKTKKPFMDSEPRYEDHPACFNEKLGYFWGNVEVRQNAYWNVLSGACGHTYGNHSVWSMTREPSPYFPFRFDEVLRHPGAEMIGHVKELRLRRDYFSYHRDDKILLNNYPGEGHMVSGRGNGYIYIYSPLGLPFSVRANLFENAKFVRAVWFDTKTGEETVFNILAADQEHMFVPETQGRGNDHVLILEAIE